MPICKRDGFESNTKGSSDKFQDNDEVFYCEVTKEIFRDYEDYFRHVMVINSTVWQCEATGRENLTYAEALKSERRAKRKMEQFKESLRAPVMLVIEAAKQSSFKSLNALVAKFLRNRYFFNEEIQACTKSTKYSKYVIKEIIPNAKTPMKNGVYENLENLQYKIERIDSKQKEVMTVPFENIRRSRVTFTLDNLAMFIKCHVDRIDGILHPKREAYKKYVTDRKITFSSLFIGKMPEFVPAKIKKSSTTSHGGDKKQQSTLNKYLIKNENGEPMVNGGMSKEQKAAELKAEREREREREREEREAKAKLLKEQMERLRLEKMQKIAEEKMKLQQKIEEECDRLLTVTDDLERSDQLVLPRYKPIQTIIPLNYLGEALTLGEFMHTFVGFLSSVHGCKSNITFQELTRAFTVRELNGPLTNILLILLSSVFDLQKEEEEECPIKNYFKTQKNIVIREPFISMAQAAKAQHYATRHFSSKLNDLPLDSFTLSEVLRLHLLASGSRVDDRADRWRVLNRNGYSSTEDPGLYLRLNHPEILRKLKYESVFALSFDEILTIIQCLMGQILTYSSPISLLEERQEEMHKARVQVMNLTFAENRREKAIENQKQVLQNEFKEEIKKDKTEAEKKRLEEVLNRKIADLIAHSEREHRKYEDQLEDLHSALFNYMVYLGSDRAYRKYYVFESLPGIFVEHPDDNLDVCLENPPTNKPRSQINQDQNYPKTRKEMRIFLTKKYTEEDKKAKIKKLIAGNNNKMPLKGSVEDKENVENLVNDVKLAPVVENGIKTDVVVVENDVKNVEMVKSENENPSQIELYMCTGDPSNCIVHNSSSEGRLRWSYLYEKSDLETLIESLNPLGIRESKLKKQLSNLKDLIVKHIKKCPTEWLTIDEKNLNKYREVVMLEATRKTKLVAYPIEKDEDADLYLYNSLISSILEFEEQIYTGDLGRLKVKDMRKWREDLGQDRYDPQGKLTWGPPEQNKSAEGITNGEVEDHDEDDESEMDGEDEEGEEGGGGGKFSKYLYHDPGSLLDAVDVNEYCKGDEKKKVRISNMRENVKNLASALLQVEQAIERRFLKYPFGPTKNLKNKSSIEVFLKRGEAKLRQWELSLMESTSYSQIFLHLNVLHDCITWYRSTNKSNCAICRKGTDPDQMLLCDECNAGTHMYCMQPKMKKVPEGNWYCKRCCKLLGYKNEHETEKKKTRKKRNFVVDEEDNEQEEEENEEILPAKTNGRSKKIKMSEIEDMMNEEENDEEVSSVRDEVEEDEELQSVGTGSAKSEVNEESANEESENEESAEGEEEDICQVCSYEGSDLSCVRCKDGFHLECINLKRPPRYNFICTKCKSKEEKKRPKPPVDDEYSEDEGSDSDSSDAPPRKRGRPSKSNSRKSLSNGKDTSHSEYSKVGANGRRSYRRTNDNLPLNTPVLYDLLTDLMKHESAWPFLRPVSQTEVPDYYEIVKTPMDLAKIKSKLNMGEYSLNEQVLNDLQLVFSNCDQYNMEDNEIYKAGCNLEKYVIQRCQELNLNFKPSEMQN